MTTETAELMKRVENLEKTVARLSTGKRKTWVKASDIKKLTGWDNEKMRRNREAGIIHFEKRKDGFFYLLESLNPVFIKNADSEHK